SPLGRGAGGAGSCDLFPQCLPFQQLHSDEGLTLVLVDVVNRADVGMIERTRSPRLALKAFQGLAVLCKMFRQELEGNEAAELGVLGLVDYTHTAATQLLEDAVMRNCLANHAEGVRPLRVILRCSCRQVNRTGWGDVKLLV